MSRSPSNFFNQAVSTKRATESVDETGSTIQTYATYLTGVALAIHPNNGDDNVRAGRPASATTFKCYGDPATDILVRDQIIWGSRTLTVIDPPRDVAGQGRLLAFTCEERS